MREFIKYDIEQNVKKKMYTSSELDNNIFFKRYNNRSYIYDRNNGLQYSEYKNNELIYEAYRINDKYHRLDGPARINYETNEFEYWIDGKRYKSEFEYWIAVGNYRKEKENK